MSKYSDHTTMGGQVLAHRFRMMAQNWRIIGLVGYLSGIAFFIFFLLSHWRVFQLWNYLCCLKAKYRISMTHMPETLFNTSFLCDASGRWREFADYFIVKAPVLVDFRSQFEESLEQNLEFSVAVGLAAVIIMVSINKCLGKSLNDSKELISGHDYVKGTEIKKYIKKRSDITLAGIPYPKGTECRHTILTGTTGSGKTNVMIELLDQLTAKNEKIVIVDTIGTFVNRYYKKDRDVILNPLAKEHVPWSFLNECTEDIFIKNAAACLMNNGNTHDKFWEDACMVSYCRGDANENLFAWILGSLYENHYMCDGNNIFSRFYRKTVNKIL